MARHKRRQKKYIMKGNAIAGYGIYATQDIAPKELIFSGEGMAQRMVTRSYIDKNWNVKEKETFRKYAYPLSKELFLLWDNNPANWAPQNHSCDPNTAYEGLNVVALRNISKGEELTLNYASFLDEHMEPFECRCGAANCCRWITGITNNSVTERESHLNR
jgi:D-alanine-D-alanine ligase